MPEKKKILIVTFTIPYPADDGGKIYIFGTVNYLRYYYDITILLKISSENDLVNLNALKNLWPDVEIQTVNYIPEVIIRPPIKQSVSAKILRMLRRIKRATVRRRKVSIEPSIVEAKKIVFPIKRANEFTLLDEQFLNKVESIFRSSFFDIVQIEYTNFLSLVNLIPSQSIKIFVEIESRYSLLNDYKNVLKNDKYYLDYVVNNAKHLEAAYMNNFDLILALSEDDVKRLSKLLPGKEVLLNPYSVLDEHIRSVKECETFSSGKMIFLGSESHDPNRDAVEWFIESILPLVTLGDNFKLHITGRWSDEFKVKYLDNNRVVFTGYLHDLSSILKDSIMVVPIRIGGGGIRAKVIQSMAYGIPIISTTLGCEGVGIKHNESVLVADSEKEFANSIHDIVQNNKKALSLLKKARDIIEKKYTQNIVGKQRHDIYIRLLESNDFRR